MRKAKFTETGTFGAALANGEDDVYTVEEFKNFCKAGAFVDHDGDGEAVLADGTIMDDTFIQPSRLYEIPREAKYIIWYNK